MGCNPPIIKTPVIASGGGGGGGSAPTGPAGGRLSGTYPDPILASSGVTSGSYGSSTLIPVFTVSADGTISVASTVAVAATYTDEQAQDAIAAALTDSATIDFTYNDAGNTITAVVIDDSISNAKLRNSAATSVIGRAGGSVGDPADIAATADNQVLGRSGGSLAFGTVQSLTNMSSTSVLGRSTGSAGVAADIGATADFQVLARTGGTLAFTDTVSAITLAATSIVGRQTGTAGVAAAIQATADRQALGRTGGQVIFTDTKDLISVAAISLLGNPTGIAGASQEISATAANQVLGNLGVSLGFDDPKNFISLAGTSVLGRATNSTGTSAAIAASADGQVLYRNGTSLTFGQIGAASIANNAITNALIRDSAGLSVIGRSANSTGDPADIVAGTDGHVLRLSGTTLGFGTVATAGIADGAITAIKLATDAAVKKYTGTCTTAVSTTSPTTIISVSIPANDIADGDELILDAIITGKNNSGSSATFEIFLDVNGSTFTLVSPYGVADNATAGEYRPRILFTRDGADLRIRAGDDYTSAIQNSPAGFNELTSVASWNLLNEYSGTNGAVMTPSFTGAITIAVKAQMSVSHADCYIGARKCKVLKY